MTPDELDLAFTKVRDELKMTSYEARQKAEEEIRAYVESMKRMDTLLRETYPKYVLIVEAIAAQEKEET